MDVIISIVIPVYNTEKMFPRCLDSILEQSFSNLEIIVVNDGSPGNIDMLISEYMKKDSRVKYTKHTENKGLFQARLTGAALAHGEYIAFADSDDYVSSDYYHTLYKKMTLHNADIVVGHTINQRGERDNYLLPFHDLCFTFETLEGKEIRERFFEQKGLCYAWHTIWNKLYKKSLWDRCVPYYNRIQKHVIMTEDIAFSIPMLYFAEKIATTDNDGYFYCSNEDASTNAQNISIQRFCKNMEDMSTVFNFVGDFLNDQNAPKNYLDSLLEFRKYYSRIWRELGDKEFSGNDRILAKKVMDNFLPGYTKHSYKDDHFFSNARTESSAQIKWTGGLEYIKDQIINNSCQYVSFDIFDTLVQRPLLEPTDLFFLLNKKFNQLVHSSLDFRELRIKAEELARFNLYKQKSSYQDVTLEEIYESLSKEFRIDPTICKVLMEAEQQLEFELCSQRKAAKELYDLALLVGKQIIITSDMYLDVKTIKRILSNCGFTSYSHLFLSSQARMTKHNGSLFDHVIAKLNTQGKNILHIGDTWKSDIVNAQARNIKTIFFPKSKDVFSGSIENTLHYDCLESLRFACGPLVDQDKLLKSPGLRSMLALVCNKYFDNPYRSFNSNSQYNIDPYFMGYFPVGMHLVSLSQWIISETSRLDKKVVSFLARDGYMPMKAYQIARDYYPNSPCAEYRHVSRKSVLPAMLHSSLDLYNLPVEYRNHSCNTLLELLEFCSKDLSSEEKRKIISSADLLFDQQFQSYHHYKKFLDLFILNIYDVEKHRACRAVIQAYFKDMNEKTHIAFDMGYSGRIQAAITSLCQQPIPVLFIHQDTQNSFLNQTREHFKITSFYDYTPYMSGLIREHLLSEQGGTCVGYQERNGMVYPILHDQAHPFQQEFIINLLQKGALDFCHDFWKTFGNYKDYLPLKYLEASLPFEGFLRDFREVDLKIFGASYFEDMIYGASASINIEDFLKQSLEKIRKSSSMVDKHLSQRQSLELLTMNKSACTKAFIFLMLDRSLFKEKLLVKLQRHDFIYKILRKIYRTFR